MLAIGVRGDLEIATHGLDFQVQYQIPALRQITALGRALDFREFSNLLGNNPDRVTPMYASSTDSLSIEYAQGITLQESCLFGIEMAHEIKEAIAVYVFSDWITEGQALFIAGTAKGQSRDVDRASVECRAREDGYRRFTVTRRIDARRILPRFDVNRDFNDIRH